MDFSGGHRQPRHVGRQALHGPCGDESQGWEMSLDLGMIVPPKRVYQASPRLGATKDMSVNRLAAGLVIAAGIAWLSTVSSKADTIYTYTGNKFTTAVGPYTTNDR